MSRNNHVTRAITVYVDGNKCNLNCSYCYISNSRYDGCTEKINLIYDLHTMIEAFSVERLGGIADIVVIGSAETLLIEPIVPFIHGLLEYGHIVTVVTNATLTKRIVELVNIKEYRKNLIIKASLHYLELKKRNLLSTYFDNIKYIVESGVSCYPFVTICEEYLPYIEEISEYCFNYLGVKPQCSPCLEVINSDSTLYHSEFKPEITDELVKRIEKSFDTRIFNEIVKNRKMNPQEHFCYAGLWSFGVDFVTGNMYKCHNVPIDKNFYEDKTLELTEPIACSCGIESCCLQYNFFAEGLIPDYNSGMLLGDMIYTEGFVSKYIRDMLNVRFDEIYSSLSSVEEGQYILSNKNKQIKKILMEKERNPFLKEEIYRKKRSESKIYIYGSGHKYKQYRYSIGFKFEAFLDSYVKDEKYVDGKRVYNIEDIDCNDAVFIIICVEKREEIEKLLESKGLVKGRNYV